MGVCVWGKAQPLEFNGTSPLTAGAQSSLPAAPREHSEKGIHYIRRSDGTGFDKAKVGMFVKYIDGDADQGVITQLYDPQDEFDGFEVVFKERSASGEQVTDDKGWYTVDQVVALETLKSAKPGRDAPAVITD